MAITCQKAGCGQPATHALQIGCGTFAEGDEVPPRARILMGVVVCAACLDTEDDAGKWLRANPAIGQLLSIAMAPLPPDLDRAVILGVAIDSPEYRELQIHELNGRGH